MHYYDGKTCNIDFNSDFSGDVHMNVQSGRVEQHGDYATVTIAAKDLLNFVAEYVRSERISKLEQMDWVDLLK